MMKKGKKQSNYFLPGRYWLWLATSHYFKLYAWVLLVLGLWMLWEPKKARWITNSSLTVTKCAAVTVTEEQIFSTGPSEITSKT